jgi:uncharacterized protein YjdB
MTKSGFYDATEEDSRSWSTDNATRAALKDSDGVANAAALEDAAQATNPIDTIEATPATVAIKAATTATDHTAQISVAGKEGTVASDAGFSVTYSSSSTGKATVSDTGLITGVAAGTATITVTAVHDTSATDTVVATVS